MLLSSIDLGVVTVVRPLFLVQSVTEILGRQKCLYNILYKLAAHTITPISAMTLFIMNIERYLSIVHPTFYRSFVSKRKIIFVFTSFGATSLIGTAIR